MHCVSKELGPIEPTYTQQNWVEQDIDMGKQSGKYRSRL